MNDNKQKKLDETAVLLQKGSRLCAAGDTAQLAACLEEVQRLNDCYMEKAGDNI